MTGGEHDLLAIAHRAGNSLRRLALAEAAGADVVEADVFFNEGRLEVRHSKTMGPIPLLWDRWSLEPGWRRRLELEDVVRAARPETTLMVDMKRYVPGFVGAVIATMRRAAPGRRYWVCSQSWEVVEPFEEVDEARPVYSIGKGDVLSLAFERFRPGDRVSISIHRRLLDAATVERLRERADLLMTWPVNDMAMVERVHGWGVNAVTTDRLEIVERIVAERRGSHRG